MIKPSRLVNAKHAMETARLMKGWVDILHPVSSNAQIAVAGVMYLVTDRDGFPVVRREGRSLSESEPADHGSECIVAAQGSQLPQ
jgi:hypothetical protein